MKKVILLVTAFIFSASLAFAQIELQSGTFSATAANSGYTLDKNSGDRTYLLEVNFPVPFEKAKPKIVLSVNRLDADNTVNLRYKVEAISISRDNFTIKISTWADSRVFEVGGTWLAYVE